MTAIALTSAAARDSLRGLADGDSDDVALERFARAVWSGLIEPGDGVAGEFITRLGPVAALSMVNDAEPTRSAPPGASDELRKGFDRWMPRLSPDAIGSALHTAGAARVRLLTPLDDDWPRALDDLGIHSPVALWVRGDPARLTGGDTAVAIVGARAATSYGEHVAGDLASDLGASGTTIVSGAAYGIDGSAHRSALANGARTVALLAGGAERAYPAGHTRLLDAISEHGVVVSEVPCGSSPTKWRFLHKKLSCTTRCQRRAPPAQ